MPDDSRDADVRPSPDALLEDAKRETRPAEDISRRGARRRQDLRNADVRPGAKGRRRRRRDRRRRDAWPQGDRGAGRGLRGHSARAASTTRAGARRNGPRRHSGAAPRRWCWSTNWPTPTRPGSRHPKRYLDVQEILAQGIDVYTTLNIQHVESLNDVVAQITRVRVRETVPDSIIDRADDVEIIDLTPDDLIKRLHEGKVYLPDDREARDRELFLARQSDGAARTGAAPHGPAGRRAAAEPHAGARHRRSLGGRRTGAGLRRRAAARAPRWSATPGGRPIGSARPGPRSMSRPRARPAWRKRTRTGWRRLCAWPSSWAARRSRFPARTSRRTSSATRRPTTSPISSSASRQVALARVLRGLGHP